MLLGIALDIYFIDCSDKFRIVTTNDLYPLWMTGIYAYTWPIKTRGKKHNQHEM